MQGVWARVLAGLVVLALGCASAAAASTSVAPTTSVEPGVTIDEGSPAAKEYALALTRARRTGFSPARNGSSSEAPFGAGITPPSSSGKGGPGANGTPRGGARTHAGGSASASAGSGASGETAPASSLPAAVLRADRTSAGGDGSLFALLGGGVAILVLGALGGVVLRHNRRPPSHA